MVNDLLELARVTSGKTAVRPGTIQVEELFGLLRGMFRPLHHNAAVALVFEPAEGLPSLYADEAKLAQILRNLISNALKFTRQGEVRVACSVDQERSTATFTVADTGVGIAPDDVVSIFDEFVQIENAFQAAAHGAGLGLAVCQRLTAVLGGRLDVRSEVGTGSEFTVELPLVYVAPDEADELVSGSPGAADDIESGRSALIIDDDEVSRYLTGRTLRDRGYEVAEAPDGLSGLEAARERRPSLIVLDLKMPELDGFIVLHELKMDFRTAEIPVVIHTAKPVTAQERSLLGAAVAIVDKRDAGRGTLGAVIESLERGD
jgi:CheY-like chemotaxis protein/anti-sigma regulatory factor (Ser/Thr protein kinase)